MRWMWLSALVCLLLIGMFLLLVGYRHRVTVSKETTYFTEPLREDGYPDYVAALNRRMSEGVTPENNAVALWWQAMGPSEIDVEDRDA